MVTLREAAQQALEAIESDTVKFSAWTEKMLAAQTALRAALAEPEQEPVAWAEEIIDDLHALYDTEMIRENDSGDALVRLDDAIACVEDAKQHYTAPTPRQWVSLTEQEMYDLFFNDQYGPRLPEYLVNTIKCVEAALKEKNNGS